MVEDVKGSLVSVRDHSTSVSLSRHSRRRESDNRDNKWNEKEDKQHNAQRKTKGEQALPKPLVEEMKSTDGNGQWHEHQLFCRL